jgi:Tol biopolymer transport system component
MTAFNPARPLRLGSIAVAVLTLAACGGGDITEPDTAAANLAAADEPAARAGTLAASTLAAGSLPAGAIELVTSVNGRAATASSQTCSVSANGRLVLFASDGAAFVASDTNGRTDVFLKNLDTGDIQRVTTQSNGAQLAEGGSCRSMTPDGRFVSFGSGTAVFVKDTQTGQLTQASPAAGTVPQVQGYFGGSMSADGRNIVFVTQPVTTQGVRFDLINVVPRRIMLRDLQTGSLQTLATDNGIVAQGQVIGLGAAISSDGTRVAFVSSFAGLVPGDNNNREDVFVRDLDSGSTTLVSSTSEGVASTAGQYEGVSLRSDNTVSFGTAGLSNLGPRGLYLKDLATGSLTLVLGSPDGDATALSADGRHVLFTRIYSNFDRRVFLRDRATGQDRLVSASASGTASNGNSTGPRMSRDGSTVVFGSSARNLVSPRPQAGVFQVYAKSVAASGAN